MLSNRAMKAGALYIYAQHAVHGPDRSYGMGMSTRVSNQNRHCEMAKQIRLCMVRPCSGLREQRDAQKQGRKGQRMEQSPKSVHFTFRNCSSVQAFRPRFCGQCSDGRCCTPHATQTALLQFRCPSGAMLKRPVMFIHTCVCRKHCPQGKKQLPHSAEVSLLS